MRYNTAVLIGRFQPFHNGHVHAVAEALRLADRVIILIGSSYQPRTTKNPFTYEEREDMIMQTIEEQFGMEDYSRVYTYPVEDFPYQEHRWIEEVQRAVADNLTVLEGEGVVTDDKIVLVGHEKDASSFYLKVFPQWDYIDTGFEQLEDGVQNAIDATVIREYIFENKFQYARGVLPNWVFGYIATRWSTTPEAARLFQEWEAIKAYRKSWANSPYPPVFVTVDAVVVQSGHVLMIQRGRDPGRGLWALPGGFVEENERIETAAIRELLEETTIKLQPDTIRRCLRGSEVFDAPGRDLRGRTYSHAFLFKLNDEADLPRVKAADDAAAVHWLKLSDLDPEQIYADHYHIIQKMLGKL